MGHGHGRYLAVRRDRSFRFSRPSSKPRAEPRRITHDGPNLSTRGQWPRPAAVLAAIVAGVVLLAAGSVAAATVIVAAENYEYKPANPHDRGRRRGPLDLRRRPAFGHVAQRPVRFGRDRSGWIVPVQVHQVGHVSLSLPGPPGADVRDDRRQGRDSAHADGATDGPTDGPLHARTDAASPDGKPESQLRLLRRRRPPPRPAAPSSSAIASAAGSQALLESAEPSVAPGSPGPGTPAPTRATDATPLVVGVLVLGLLVGAGLFAARRRRPT